MTATVHCLPVGQRILFADRDDGVRALLPRYLRRHGYRLDVVQTLDAVRACLARGRYDLVVLDLVVSREEGPAFLEWTRRCDAPAVILLSAVGADIDRIVAARVGADRILAKPFEPRALLARVRAALCGGARPDILSI